MNTTSKPLILRALGFIAATCVAQVLVLDTALALVQPVQAAEVVPVTVTARADGFARNTTATAPRRCDALDSFGSPVRPCRG